LKKKDENVDVVLKRLKGNIDTYIEKFGLLNIQNRMSEVIKGYEFQGLESQSLIKLTIYLKITSKVHHLLFFHKKVIILDARPLKDGSMEVMMPVYYDVNKLIEYLADMDRWSDLYETTLSELKNQGTINIFEKDNLMFILKGIIEEEFKLAVKNNLLIKKEELLELMLQDLKN